MRIGASNSFHPHLHCSLVEVVVIKPKTELWKKLGRNKDDFLFPGKSFVRLCSEQNICTDWKKLIANQDVTVPFHLDIQEFIGPLYSKDWVVYAKNRSVGLNKSSNISEGIHKVAITNSQNQKNRY
ncbi:MAG: transposase [Saprospiraceae bacterium]|nr:transposase [Saprospiraceae bacterium]